MDTVFHVLENQHRRRLLVALLDHNPQNVDDPPIRSAGERTVEDGESYRIQMMHTHLPKLEAVGFIEWNRDTNAVRKGSQFDGVRPLLEVLQNHASKLPNDWR